jgi:uncharacterized Fe-S center protein
MQKVYFKAIDSYSKTSEISTTAAQLLQKIQETEKIIDYSKPIPIKVHFGEKNCSTFIEPKNFEGIINYLKEKIQTNRKKNNLPPTNTQEKPSLFYVETNVLYKGERTTRETHIALAKKHGFTQLPIIIADGEMGEENIEVDISESNPKHFKKCKIGKTIAENEQMIILAHFKGHGLSGFGGAIKQLAMGGAARAGKLDMHSNSKPLLNPIKCKKCFTCAKNCPTNACIINTPIPHIDNSKCIGCAKCIAVCPFDTIKVNWVSTLPNTFEEKLAEYAYATQKGKKIIYINFALNITKECDCIGKTQKVIASDIGVLASSDPVALDRASLDLLVKKEGKKMFRGEHTLEHAEKLGTGKQEYKLIEV